MIAEANNNDMLGGCNQHTKNSFTQCCA